MAGESLHYKFKYAEAADEVKAYPGAVSEPATKLIDKEMWEGNKVAAGTSYAAAKTFTKAEIEAGIEFSATRAAAVWIKANTTSITAPAIGGVSLISVIGTGPGLLIVPPGQKLKGTSTEATAGEFNALLL